MAAGAACSTFMYWIGWNDKLLANPTHRITVATAVVVVAHVANARTEEQAPSAAMVRRVERRTPNAAVVAYIVNWTIFAVACRRNEDILARISL